MSFTTSDRAQLVGVACCLLRVGFVWSRNTCQNHVIRPPNYFRWGERFLGRKFFFIRIEARNPRGKREWEMTFEVRYCVFEQTKSIKSPEIENDQISAFKYWPGSFICGHETGQFLRKLSFRNWNFYVETWYELFLGRGPQKHKLWVWSPPSLWWLSTVTGRGPHQTDTFINESNLLLGRCLHLFTILFLRKPHFYVFGGSQFCQLWTWHVFFLLDLKPRTRSGYVCLKRNDFPQRRARKGEHFRARRNWCLCGPSLWDIPW